MGEQVSFMERVISGCNFFPIVQLLSPSLHADPKLLELEGAVEFILAVSYIGISSLNLVNLASRYQQIRVGNSFFKLQSMEVESSLIVSSY